MSSLVRLPRDVEVTGPCDNIMEEQTPQPVQEQKEQKPQRVDELDVIGGLLFRAIKSFFTFYRKFFKSQQYQ
jgi:hypothetical protein